jgi:hypothetical protein
MSETQTKRRIPFWLTLSVMANLLLFGLITGMVLRTPHHRMGPDGMGHERPPVLGEASREDRMMVRRMMMEAFQSAKRARRRALRWAMRYRLSPMMPRRCDARSAPCAARMRRCIRPSMNRWLSG